MYFYSITYKFFLFFVALSFVFCTTNNRTNESDDTLATENETSNLTQAVIVDSDYSFAQAIAESGAPAHVVANLVLIDVEYYSTDEKLHRGQLLVNKAIETDMILLFDYIKVTGFPIFSAIPIVRFDWDDNASMQANNSYVFCYRDITFSKHATGMAIDINPLFNPLRWKAPYQNRPNKPANGTLDQQVEGTLFPGHHLVEKLNDMGYRWGHYFSKNFDDHHFEKR